MPFSLHRIRAVATPRGLRSALALVTFLIVAVPVPARATDYWVANGGSDGASGLAPSTAWATLQHAADRVGPGDTVHVLDGSYQGFYLDTSGTPGSPITFVAEGAGVAITADNSTTPDGINLEGASHIVIDGFVVNGRTRAGVRAVLGAFVTVRNCRLGSNGKWGFLSGFVDDLLIERNEAHHSQLEHGIYVSNSGDRPVIRDNIVHDNRANGIHMNGDASLGGDGVISGALVERNVIYGNGAGGGSGINMDGVTTSVVRNNLLYDNHASGVSLYRIDGGSGSRDNLVVNNTILSASDGRWCVNISDGSTGNRVVNNILWNDHSFRGAITIDTASRPGFTSDYNSVIGRFSIDGGNSVLSLASWQGQGYDPHSFVATPAQHFVAPGSDFHLVATSPARDAGSFADAPADDLEGNPRPVGAGVDLGCYETQLETCGDGAVDPGEQCGEPGLACASGEICDACACVNAPVCASGIAIAKAALALRAEPFRLRFSGEAVIPPPWQGVEPIAHGIRIVLEATAGPGGADLVVPGGAYADGVGWKVNRRGTTWTYRDRLASAGPVTKVVLRDRSARIDGQLRWAVQAKGASVTLPDPAGVRSTIVLGAPGECAALVWSPPDGPRPRCRGDAARLSCR